MRFPNKIVNIKEVIVVLPEVEVCCTHIVDRETEDTPRNESVDLHAVEIIVDKSDVRFIGDKAYVDVKSLMADEFLEVVVFDVMQDYADMEARMLRSGLWR